MNGKNPIPRHEEDPQEAHDRPENLVEAPHEAEQAARSLEDAVDSHGTLEGYYAMNEEKPPEKVAERVDKPPQAKSKTAG